jgi:SAM-dependent methyltransferase
LPETDYWYKIKSTMVHNSILKPIWFFRFTVFLSAFLLFQVQPMISKAMLPIFGGSYLVWAVCMLFFQGMLLLGYVYAHLVQRRLGIFGYARWHSILILMPLLFLPFPIGGLNQLSQNIPLALEVPRLLFLICGLPFFSLATAALILQSWLSISKLPQKNNPYTLYSASNIGSISALLSYPFFIEPLFDLKQQSVNWWVGYLVLILLHFVCMPRTNTPASAAEHTAIRTIPVRSKLQWFLLSAAGCVCLLATTNVLTFDLAAVPFLWILPLSIYLLTFVLAFKRTPWYPHWTRQSLIWIIVTGTLFHLLSPSHILWLILSHLGILFIVCLNCHGTLVQLKPNSSNLTSFYLFIAAGGFAGSLLVSVILPLVSSSLIEYPLAFVITCLALNFVRKEKIHLNYKLIISLLALILSLTLLPWTLANDLKLSGQIVFLILAFPVFLIILGTKNNLFLTAAVVLTFGMIAPWTQNFVLDSTTLHRSRNFYGIYHIYEKDNQRVLQHGSIIHGRQYLSLPKSNTPLSYFHPTTPAGELLSTNWFNFKDIAMVGLGSGALATYFNENQKLTVYELDRDNLPLAEKFFSYLSISRNKGAKQSFVFGDARIALGEVRDKNYDLIIIDAFNSGSIPIHLLTVEAFKEYFRVLRPNGIILVHISNKLLNLSPILFSIAQAEGYNAAKKSNDGIVHPDADHSTWMTFCREKSLHATLQKRHKWQGPSQKSILKRPWTDRYTNLLDAILE